MKKLIIALLPFLGLLTSCEHEQEKPFNRDTEWRAVSNAIFYGTEMPERHFLTWKERSQAEAEGHRRLNNAINKSDQQALWDEGYRAGYEAFQLGKTIRDYVDQVQYRHRYEIGILKRGFEAGWDRAFQDSRSR